MRPTYYYQNVLGLNTSASTLKQMTIFKMELDYTCYLVIIKFIKHSIEILL